MPTDPTIHDLHVTLLGTGTSTGIPVIGCDCRVCTSTDPRDQRLRCACYVEADGVGLVIDTGPDFRTQALRAGIEAVDAILFTHHHFDHVVGLDDVRPYLFHNREAIPCYAQAKTEQVLRDMFRYIFRDGSYPGVPRLTLTAIAPEPFEVLSRDDAAQRVTVRPIPAMHGDLPIYGYRIGRFAYLTDTSALPASSMALLEGVEVFVVDALRHRPHHSHFTIEQATVLAQRVGATQTYFIHMTHDLLHAETDAALPEGINLGYDGLRFHLRDGILVAPESATVSAR
ncbi:MAG: MBL fold metallo-hydrolase [Rhodothermales bacterium]